LGLCFLLLGSDISICAFLFFPVKFIDFKIGEDSGYVRFEDPEAAQKARAAAVLAEQGGLLVKNYIATLEPVAGRGQKLLSSYFFRLFGSSVLHDD
jgi:lupus La protein